MGLKRILVVPVISTKGDVWRESDFVTWFQFCKCWPDVYVYFLMNPTANLPAEYCLPNICWLKWIEWMPFAMAQAAVTEKVMQMFNPLNGEYQVDLVFTSKTVAAASIKRALYFASNSYLPVMISELKAADHGSTHDVTTDLDLLLRSASYVECPSFVGTIREKEIVMSAARRYLNPAMVSKVDQNVYAKAQGAECYKVREIGRQTPKNEKFTILFSARFNANKKWEQVLTFMEKFAQMHDVRIQTICPSDPVDKAVTMSYYQKLEKFEALPREEYLRKLAAAHVTLSMSVEEGFAFGWAEQLSTGNPVLLPRRAWAKGLMPFPEYDVCFHENEKQLLALLTYVMQNYDKFRAQIQPAVDKFCDANELANVAEDYRSIMWQRTEGSFSEFREWQPRLLETLNEMPAEFSMAEYVKLAGKKGMYFGQFLRQLSSISTYRNLWMWLRDAAEPLHTQEMRFRKK